MVATPPAPLSTLPLRLPPEPEWKAEPAATSPWLFVCLAVLGLGFVLLGLIRRRRAARPDPRQERRREYDRLLATPDAAAQLVGLERLLRQSLAETLGPRAYSDTTRELLAHLEAWATADAGAAPLPLEQIRQVLHAAEACKFAGAALSTDQTRQFLTALKPWLLGERTTP